MEKETPKDPKPPKYQPASIDCPNCGHIEGDMPVIAHSILGCRKPVQS